MFKLSKESKVTFLCLLVIPIVWIIVNHLGLIDGWKTKSVDLRLNSKIPGARGQILHDNESLEFVKIEENKTIPKIPKIVYVNFDAATLAMDDVGERPWDRAFFRDLSMALMEKGNARVLSFDFGFTPKSVSKMVPKENSFRSDSAMGELVAAYPKQVVLGCLYSGVTTPFVKPVGASAFPPLFKDGYSVEDAVQSNQYNYPESPTYPLQNFKDGKYLGRTGSFTVPPFRAVDNVPRWVPLWFPAGGKAHAYNLLGGKRSNLPYEMSSQHAETISSLEGKIKAETLKKAELSKKILNKTEQTKILEGKINNIKESFSSLSTHKGKLDDLNQVVKNLKVTIQANPALSSVIGSQLKLKTEEKNSVLNKISSFLKGNEKSPLSFLKDELKDLNQTVLNLKNSLVQNPSLKGILSPQIQKKVLEISELKKKINDEVNSSKYFSDNDEEQLLEDLIGLISEKKKEIERLSQNLENFESESSLMNDQLKELSVSLNSYSEQILRLSGKAEMELVEYNGTLRLVYKSTLSENESGELVDSIPNEVPLTRERPVFTLGIESILAYYGLDHENVKISPSSDSLSIFDHEGNKILEAPMVEKQFLEVNWFSAWTVESGEKELVRSAKKAFSEKKFSEYRLLIPKILNAILSYVKDFQISNNTAELISSLEDLGIGQKQIEISKSLLSPETKNENLPTFNQLMEVIDEIAYFFNPPSLNSKFNPMCGMRDVLQNSRFYDATNVKISQIEEKIQSLQGPDFMGKIQKALIQYPGNEKLIEQKKVLDQAIITNQENLITQKEELARIEEFFSYFKDAIVLIGPEEKTFQDLAPTPFDKSASPKVGVHGNLIKTLITGKYIKRLPIYVDHLATLAIGVIMAFLAVYQGNRYSWVNACGIFLLLGYIIFGFITFSNTHVVWPITAPASAGISTSFIGLAVMVVIEQKAKGRLKGMFGSYVSSELVEQMVESGEEPTLGGEETSITAFFSDVQAFSSFSELLSPTGLVDLMNEYLTAMTNILQEERGTLDKYIGDAIVAMYGAPIPMDDHAYQSVKTAILMQQRQIELREKWKSEGDKWPEIVSRMQTRIGCNTGTATVGNMGALDRFNYTMMGDMVNLAARCESGAKAYGAYIMITEETKLASQSTRDDIAFRYLDKIVVKGRKQPVAMFEPTGFLSELTQETQDCLDCFKKGIDKYLKQDWDGALKLFEKAKSLEPNKPGVTPGVVDNPSMILIDRCNTMKENPPGDNWDGVYVMTTK